jgi:hypothetical protein
MKRKPGLALAVLLTLTPAVLEAASPVPLPQAAVTVPILSHVVENGVVVASELQQVQGLESTGLLPVLFILSDPAKSVSAEWSLISAVHVRMFRLDNRVADVSDYLTGGHDYKEIVYALDIPPKQAGQSRQVFVWKNETDGVLDQKTLEAIYAKLGIAVDPLTAPPLDQASLDGFRNNAVLHGADAVKPAATTMVFLAFRSKGADPDIATQTKVRILAGVEFFKSMLTPVVEVDEDRNPAVYVELKPGALSITPVLGVYDLVTKKVVATYDPAQLAGLTETSFQSWMLNNGTPAAFPNGKATIENDRTDIAEAFINLVDKHRGQSNAFR